MAKTFGEIWYLVADGARARVVCRDEPSGAFHTLRQFRSDDALRRSSDLGSDRPGRVVESRSSTRHAVEPKHYPQREAKKAFAREMARHLNDSGARGEFDHLVLAAPARVLGEIRKHLQAGVEDRVLGELAKDLTHTPDADLGKHLAEIVQSSRSPRHR